MVLILALGIGSTTTLFSIADSVLLSEIPYREGDRLVVLRMLSEQDGEYFPASYLDAESWRERSQTLESISVNSYGQQLNLTGGDRAERVEVGFASASYFDLLGVGAALGRTFLPEEENRTSPRAVAVLTHSLWKRRFGGDPAIVGRSIQLQGLAFQVVGVLPEDFRDISPDVALYVPVTMSRLTHREGYVEDRISRWLDVFARRRPGASLEQVQQEMRSISQELGTQFPDTNQGLVTTVEPLRTYQFDFDRMRLSIITLLVGAAFVLLVGCANVTNLLLVRAVERRKEVALRLALGASRFHLIRPFLLEGLLLCLAGTLLGVGAAVAAVRLLARFGTTAYNLPAFIHFSIDLRALAAAAALALLVGLVIGAVPARKSLQVDLLQELQSESKGHSPSAGTAFTRSFLVVSAIFFSVVLLTGAGLMIKSLAALIEKDAGFRVDNVLSAQFELPTTQFQDDESVYVLYRQILEKARTLPDVEDAGLWAPGMLGASFFYKLVVPEGRSIEEAAERIKVYHHRVSPDFLQRTGITLLQGRDFNERDDARHPLVAILSRSAAEALWPGQNPIGKRFWVGEPQKVWAEVVGVVADVDQRGRLLVDHDFRRDIYFPLYQMRSRTASVLLHTRGENRETAEQLSRLLQRIAPDIPIYDIKTLRERRREEESGARLNACLLLFFASSALVLAVIGIYSILIYTVRQQSFEIGVRMALGADSSRILRHFIAKGLALLAVGLIVGLAVALGLAKTMSSILFNVDPYDPLVLTIVPCIIVLFSVPAILWPAYTATREDPSSLFRRQ